MRAAALPTALFAAAFAILCRASPAMAAISPEEQRVLDALDAGRALADMRLIAASSDGIAQGVGEGSVVAGSPEEAALAEVIARRFRELGLATRIETFPVRAYRYTVPRLHVDGEPLAAIALHAAGAVSGRRDGVPFALGNEAGGTRLRAVLVDVGDGYEADYARVGRRARQGGAGAPRTARLAVLAGHRGRAARRRGNPVLRPPVLRRSRGCPAPGQPVGARAAAGGRDQRRLGTCPAREAREVRGRDHAGKQRGYPRRAVAKRRRRTGGQRVPGPVGDDIRALRPLVPGWARQRERHGGIAGGCPCHRRSPACARAAR